MIRWHVSLALTIVLAGCAKGKSMGDMADSAGQMRPLEGVSSRQPVADSGSRDDSTGRISRGANGTATRDTNHAAGDSPGFKPPERHPPYPRLKSPLTVPERRAQDRTKPNSSATRNPAHHDTT